MEALINYLLQFGNLNKQQIDFISSKSTELTLLKEDYFSETGKIAIQVGFILEGIPSGFPITTTRAKKLPRIL